MIDTAGIRNTDDIVEKIGVEKTKKALEEADLIIYIVDSSVPMDKNDDDIIQMIKERKVIVFLNKSDLNVCITEEDIRNYFSEEIKVIKTSMIKEVGIDSFTEIIKEMFLHGSISSAVCASIIICIFFCTHCVSFTFYIIKSSSFLIYFTTIF